MRTLSTLLRSAQDCLGLTVQRCHAAPPRFDILSPWRTDPNQTPVSRFCFPVPDPENKVPETLLFPVFSACGSSMPSPI
ncbi:hypothetical protein CHARACLAT_019028 [Characodon lateralis]|uniref:Uncharacterized protein n=1 Tax=Characodon lateralis TaxID=208331 RepID=A0ABU7CPV4_9TELE|nr:hypothetical protein [Characodon lateralis]